MIHRPPTYVDRTVEVDEIGLGEAQLVQLVEHTTRNRASPARRSKRLLSVTEKWWRLISAESTAFTSAKQSTRLSRRRLMVPVSPPVRRHVVSSLRSQFDRTRVTAARRLLAYARQSAGTSMTVTMPRAEKASPLHVPVIQPCAGEWPAPEEHSPLAHRCHSRRCMNGWAYTRHLLCSPRYRNFG